MSRKERTLVVVNCRFLSQDISGVQRFAIELCKVLSSLNDPQFEVKFLAPHDLKQVQFNRDFEVNIVGSRKGHLWEQIDLVIALKKMGSPLLLNLTNTGPILYRNKIVTIHDIAFKRYPKSVSKMFRMYYSTMIPLLIKSAKHICTVSNFSKTEICEFYKVPLSKISVVYNAVSADFVSNKEQKEGKYILSVSSLNPRKNFITLLQAFDKIQDPNVRLVVVGSNDSKQFNNKGFELSEADKRISFTGYISDEELIQLYSEALCFVYPSLYEGFGIPPLEAQKSKVPVISSNAASLPEVLNDSALFFAPLDVNDLVGKMNEVVHSPELRLSLIQKGLSNVVRFNWEQSGEKLKAIIKQVDLESGN